MSNQMPDIDPVESQEWQEAVEDVIQRDGADRAHYLLDKLSSRRALLLLFLATTVAEHDLNR